MITSKSLLSVFTKNKQKAAETFRNFRLIRRSCQSLPNQYDENTNIDTSLFFTNLPNKRREKKVKPRGVILGPLIIECKNEKLNHYKGMNYGKFDVIPLASKGWYHRKSKGDYFKVLPTKQFHSAFLSKEDLPDTFEEIGVNSEVIEQLKKINVTHPTVIQAKSLPKLVKGTNLFISGECGSGKTIAYLMAMIENALKEKEKVPLNTYNAPLVIIVLPTRELAIQVGQLATTLTANLGINCYTLVGGHARDLMLKPQMLQIDILICTISVLTKHLETDLISTQFCKHVIIDDTDSFLSKESLRHFKRFLSQTKLDFTGLNNIGDNSRFPAQICFVSATTPSKMTEELIQIAHLTDLETVSTPYLHRIIQHIPQHFHRIAKPEMAQELLKIAKKNDKRKISTLIFSNKLKTTNWISLFLKENGINCARINNQASAEERMKNFRDFQSGYVNLIACTSIASLGLHFSRAKHVINYEFPVSTADYLHRCGRVGRLGQEDCLIINFISAKHEIPVLNNIEKAIRTDSPLPNIYYKRKKKYETKF